MSLEQDVTKIQEADIFKGASKAELKKRQANAYVYNVWVEVERLGVADDSDSEDVFTEKLVQFDNEDEAIKFAGEVVRTMGQ